MALSTSAQDRIAQLQQEIESLKQAQVAELTARRNAIAQELAQVDRELAELTGKIAEAPKRRARRGAGGPPRSLPLQALKELLAAAPDKTLNIRKENLELRNIKVLAEANPGLLQFGGKGPWPTVTLLK